MNHWNKIKIPSYGLTDAQVRRKSATWTNNTFEKSVEFNFIAEVKPETLWSWEDYDKSIIERVKQLKTT